MPVAQFSLDEAWDELSSSPNAVLLDVRTTAEWNFVGIPDLGSISKQVRTVEWTQFPTGEPNPDFLADATKGLSPDSQVFVICRSGARSNAAANALVDNGFSAINVAAGFEGDLDPAGHRHGGWKDQLPWRQS